MFSVDPSMYPVNNERLDGFRSKICVPLEPLQGELYVLNSK